MKYNDEHTPDSPTMVYIAPESGDAKLVIAEGVRDRGLAVSLLSILNDSLCSEGGLLLSTHFSSLNVHLSHFSYSFPHCLA